MILGESWGKLTVDAKEEVKVEVKVSQLSFERPGACSLISAPIRSEH